MKNNLVEKVQTFVNLKEVQKQIEADFNNKQYRKFDPSFGDDGCQTRPIILIPIFSKNLPYISLSEQEKCYLSLCHILTKYKIIYRDIFGIEYNEIAKPSEIYYQKNNASRIKLPLPLEKTITDKTRPDLSVYMLGEELSRLGIEILRDKAKIYDQELQEELNKGREIDCSGYKISQEATTPEVDLLLKEVLRNNYPLLIKIKRLEFQEELQCFTYLGGNILFYLPTTDRTMLKLATIEETETAKDLPGAVIEAFSIKSPKTNFLKVFPKELAEAQSFEEFRQYFIQKSLSEMLIFCCAADDNRKGKLFSTKKYSDILTQARDVINYPLNYAINLTKIRQGFPRTTTAVPFSITHLYVSTYNIETASIAELKPGLKACLDCSISEPLPSFTSRIQASAQSERSIA